ncbi:MAG: putative DNA-binding protein (MmcQ/YjbR family) [Patiriisocius sp.]|jgi:predicted DNA-binding protein (MmcQ/YjbR family)
MSKIHWNNVMLEDRIPRTLLLELMEHSYELVVSKFTKKLKAALAAL